MENVPTGSNPVKEKMRDKLKDILAARQEADETRIRKVAKKSTDERAPELSDVPLTPGERAKLAQPKEKPSNVVPNPELAAAETKPEDERQAELNQVINDFWAKQGQVAETRAKKTSRWASLAKTLGIKTKSLDDDPEVAALEKESHEKYRELLAKGIHLYKGDKAQLENFLKQFDEFEVFRTSYNQEMDERAKVCKWPESVLAGFQKIGQKWSEMSWKKKLLIGGAASGLMTVGAIGLGAGAGIFGAASLMTGWRWGFRGFGAMAAGVGRKVQLDVKLMKEIETNQNMRLKQKMDFLKQYENNLDQGIEEIILDGAGIKYARKEYEQRSLENTVRARNLALKAFVISSIIGESFRLGSQATGINMGTILKKIGGVLGMEGGEAEWQPEVPKGSPLQEIPKGPPAVPEPEVKVGGVVPEAGATDVPEVAKPKNILLGFDDIKRGGGIEKSAQAIMRQDPEQFGFDPKDPKLNAKIGQKAHLLARDMAKNMGFEGEEGLEEFNKIASQRVQEGDQIRLFRDPASGKPVMEYSGGAFGEVSAPGAIPETEISAPKASGIASAEEIAGGGKAGVAPEEMKPKAGAGVAEQQPSRVRGAGRYKLPEDIFEQERIAKENWAKASRYAEDVAKWKAEAGPQIEQMRIKAALAQVGPTRGLLNNIVTEAGIGRKGYFWGQPISKFNDLVGENLFAGEASEPDAVGKINSNKDKLRRLYEILKEYSVHGGETMDECLRKALLNSTPIIEGKRGESVGSRILQLINQKVLGK